MIIIPFYRLETLMDLPDLIKRIKQIFCSCLKYQIETVIEGSVLKLDFKFSDSDMSYFLKLQFAVCLRLTTYQNTILIGFNCL